MVYKSMRGSWIQAHVLEDLRGSKLVPMLVVGPIGVN
uniref:Uncharacterized protein n=1 Tax=Manihot esculenta TaxID=3983 RepID=A0A2C9V8T9_MANES